MILSGQQAISVILGHMKAEIEITDDQQRRLDALARTRGTLASDLLREALDVVLAKVEAGEPELSDEQRLAIRKRAFGLWKHHELDTDEYLRQLRSEWDR